MYNEMYFDQQAETIVELWGRIEAELIEDISRRIKNTRYITSTAEFELEKLNQANLLNNHAVKLISKYTGISDREIEGLLTNSSFSILEEDELIYRRALETGQLTIEPLPLDKSPRLQTTLDSCIANAKFGMSNLTNTHMTKAGNKETLTAALRRIYYDSVNLAFLQVRTGQKSTPEAVKDACTAMSKEGITITYWDSGHTDSLEVAVRRNIRTSMGQTSAEMTLARMGDYKHDLVQVSSHWGARPSHAVWQGGIYSLTGSEGYEDFYEVTGYGTGPGLCGWNCRHRFYPYFKGLDNVYPKYDEEENRKQYEDTQKQREYERNIRKAKKEKSAIVGRNGSEAEIKAANTNIRVAQASLRKYLDEHQNLYRNRSREQVYDANGTVR